MKIYKGLDDPTHNWGGALVPNSDKYTLGSITIANKNDTDGDSIIDNKDTIVIATNKGVDELDLMKLEIVADGKFSPNCSKVKLINNSFNNSVTFWEKSTKEKPFDINTEIVLQNVNFKTYHNEVVKTIWVEAKRESSFLKDIIINLNRIEIDTINGIVNSVSKDSVTATAIWVYKKNVYTLDSAKILNPDPALSPLSIDEPQLLNSIEKDLNNSYHGFRSNDNNRYGFGELANYTNNPFYTNRDAFIGGRILFEFEIFPHDICNKLNTYDITFDIARRKFENTKYYFFDSIQIVTDSFPIKLDIANDDPQDYIFFTKGDFLDEDNIPKNNEIYSYDYPSNRILYYNSMVDVQTAIVRDIQFEEYARISFNNNILLKGNDTLRGSRCSNKIEWYINFGCHMNQSLDTNNYKFQYEYIKSSLANPGNIVFTYPFSYHQTNANGNINVSYNSTIGINKAYLIEFRSDPINLNNKFFVLYRYNTTTNSFVSIIDSNSSINGPWKTNTNNYLNVEIINGTKSFQVGDKFTFRCIKFPNNLENKIKVK